MAETWKDLSGTSEQSFKVGIQGFSLKTDGSNLILMDSGEQQAVDATFKTILLTGRALTFDIHGDFPYRLYSPLGLTKELGVIFPATEGTDGQVWRKKAGSPPGIIELEWTSSSDTSACIKVDQTRLTAGSPSSITMFTKPEGAMLLSTKVVIVTPFNGTQSMSVGTAGNASKYMASTQVKLSAAARSSFEVEGNDEPTGEEELIISYSNGGATEGDAIVLCHYSIPT